MNNKRTHKHTRAFIILKKHTEGDNIVGYVRQTGIDAVKYEAWIMELIQKQNGKITRDNVVELLNVTPSQAYRLLKKMSDKGRIKLVGNGRSAYYEVMNKRTKNARVCFLCEYNEDIKKIDSKIEHKFQKSEECQGVRYRKFKITLLKEIGELNVQRGDKTSELSKIVRAAGYKDVNQFMKTFEKSCKLLEEYQKVTDEKQRENPQEKESVLSKLKAYEEEAKNKPHKAKSRVKNSQEL